MDDVFLSILTELARLVSCVLYCILAFGDACFSFYIKSSRTFTIIQLAWSMFVFFIHLWNFGKISIFLAFSGSFTVKSVNIHSFFVFAFLVANFEFANFAQKQKYTGRTVSTENNNQTCHNVFVENIIKCNLFIHILYESITTMQLIFCVTGTSRTWMFINLYNLWEKTSVIINRTTTKLATMYW